MPERIRATIKDTGERVTVLVAELPKKGRVPIRRSTGFKATINVGKLEQIPSNEPGSKLSYRR